MRLVIITGLSGSGKSTAARALEDDGIFRRRQPAAALLPKLLEMTDQEARENPHVAIVLDVRNRTFLAGWEDILQTVRREGQKSRSFSSMPRTKT